MFDRLQTLRPHARAVDHGEDVRPRRARAVGDNVRRVRYHQLACASDAARSSTLGHLTDRFGRVEDHGERGTGDSGMALRFVVVANVVEIAERLPGPTDVHTFERLGAALTLRCRGAGKFLPGAQTGNP